jgi:hypothetical protein
LRYRVLFNLILAWMFATSCLAQDTPLPTTDAAREPQAVFKQLQDYLRSHPIEFQTSFEAHNDTLGDSRGSGRFSIQRPNLLRVEVSAGASTDFSYLLVSNGKVYTIYNRENRKYAQIPAPDSPLAALHKFAGLATFEARVLEFFGAVEKLAAGRENIQATAAGSNQINGRQCEHFVIMDASRSLVATAGLPDRWDVWLDSSDVALPCKTVFTNALSRDVQTNEYSWSQTPVFLPERFAFTAPTGSEKVDGVGSLGLSPPK